MVGELLKAAISPLTGLVGAHIERKKAVETAKAKIKASKEDHDFELKMSDKEWEALGKAAEDSTWKDEYITIIFTSPIVLVLCGALWATFTGDRILLTGALEGIKELKSLGLDYGQITLAVVYAAIGLKILKR